MSTPASPTPPIISVRRAAISVTPWPVNDTRHLVNLALIGFMGTGKSSAGRLVAEQLHFDYLDTDELIQSRTGRTITEIFDVDGEAAFRET